MSSWILSAHVSWSCLMSHQELYIKPCKCHYNRDFSVLEAIFIFFDHFELFSDPLSSSWIIFVDAGILFYNLLFILIWLLLLIRFAFLFQFQFSRNKILDSCRFWLFWTELLWAGFILHIIIWIFHCTLVCRLPYWLYPLYMETLI